MPNAKGHFSDDLAVVKLGQLTLVILIAPAAAHQLEIAWRRIGRDLTGEARLVVLAVGLSGGGVRRGREMASREYPGWAAAIKSRAMVLVRRFPHRPSTYLRPQPIL